MANINETFIIEPIVVTDKSQITPVVLSVNGVSANTDGSVSIDKSNIGLDKIDNTGDLDKPVSNATKSMLDNLSSGVGNASPNDIPLSGINTYNVSQTGTYVNFGGITISTGDTASGLVQLRKISNVWTKVITPINLSNYYSKNETDQKFFDNVGKKDVATLVSEPLLVDDLNFSYQHNSSTFSGEGWPIGNPQNFNQVTFKIRARSNISLIKTVIKTTDKNGAIVANKDLPITILSGSSSLVTVKFDSIIANSASSQLYFMFAADGYTSAWSVAVSNSPYPYPSYAVSSYQTVGSTNFSAFSDVTSPSIASLFLYTKIEITDTKVFPSINFAENVAASSSTIQTNISNINTLNANVNTAFVLGTAENNFYEDFDESGATMETLISTFNGWGTAIGAPTNFNHIKFKVQARAGNATPISKVRYWITQTGKTGTILATGYITGLSIAGGTNQYLTATLSSTIANTGNTMLYFFWMADQLADIFKKEGVYDSTTYPNQYVTTDKNIDNVTPATYSPATSGNRTNWIKTSFIYPSAVPTTDFLNKIIEKTPAPTPTPLTDLVTAEIILPSKIFAVEGQELNIYFANIIKSNLKNSLLDFDITCAKGTQFDKFYRVTPVSGDAGSYPLIIDVYFAAKKIATASITLYVVAANTASGVTRSIIGVGDSTLSAGQPLSTLITEHSADVMTLTFKGTQGSGSNKHEGRSGWAISSFTTSGITYYKFNVSGVVTPPSVYTYYTDGTNTYRVVEINLTSGTGYVNMSLSSGTASSPASGTLNLVAGSGNGDVVLTYSSWSSTPANPFWNTSTNQLDFANYLSGNSITMTANDWVFIHLGINDVFGQTDDASLSSLIDTMISQLRSLITNMKSAVTGLRIAICTTIMPTISQDGMGANYTAGQTLTRYTQNIQTWQKRLISEFDNDTERASKNYLIAWNAIVDRENNMQKGTMNANKRNTTQITTYTNGVHPAQSGYDQMGDQLFAFLKYMA